VRESMGRRVSAERASYGDEGAAGVMASSLCAECSGVMVIKVVAPDPRDDALQLRSYVCAECAHSRTYSVDGGES
jgi:hypothetical protein